ncbi:unnamed protein product [Oncorhynchus mykiss]|uniref:Uncharacterized protein n=1 Tax=Oncorhynchus mykiss TaxID=8022 RepID=A0A060Z9F0_ONCMY|nr:unnamed protein product [Oncorhynchus mykiss]
MGNQRNQPRPQKKIVDLHKSCSSLGAISKRLKTPRSSVQTIVHKYKHHGTTQPSYRSGRRCVLSPRDECTLGRNVQINPRITAKDLVKMLEETGTKISISTVKLVLYRHNLKGRSARTKPLLLNLHKKKPDYGLQLHMGTKIVLFGEMSSGLMKQKYNFLAIMFGGKRVMVTSGRTPSQPCSTGVAASCCGGCFAAGGTGAPQNRWHHEGGKLCGYIEATSQDIS